MADFFLDNSEPVPDSTPTVVSDPAADFLAGEQSDLAEIEGQVYDQVPLAEGGFAEISPESQNEIINNEDLTLEETAHVDTNNNGIIHSGDLIPGNRLIKYQSIFKV